MLSTIDACWMTPRQGCGCCGGLVAARVTRRPGCGREATARYSSGTRRGSRRLHFGCFQPGSVLVSDIQIHARRQSVADGSTCVTAPNHAALARSTATPRPASTARQGTHGMRSLGWRRSSMAGSRSVWFSEQDTANAGFPSFRLSLSARPATEPLSSEYLLGRV
jgi:hypothetical protein